MVSTASLPSEGAPVSVSVNAQQLMKLLLQSCYHGQCVITWRLPSEADAGRTPSRLHFDSKEVRVRLQGGDLSSGAKFMP